MQVLRSKHKKNYPETYIFPQDVRQLKREGQNAQAQCVSRIDAVYSDTQWQYM